MKNLIIKLVLLLIISYSLMGCFMSVSNPIRRINYSTFIDSTKVDMSVGGGVINSFFSDEDSVQSIGITPYINYELGLRIRPKSKLILDATTGGYGVSFEQDILLKDKIFLAVTPGVRYSSEKVADSYFRSLENSYVSYNITNELVFQPNTAVVIRGGILYEKAFVKVKCSINTYNNYYNEQSGYKVNLTDEVIGFPFKVGFRYRRFEILFGYVSTICIGGDYRKDYDPKDRRTGTFGIKYYFGHSKPVR